MNAQRGFSLPIILAVVAIVLVGAGVAAFLYITNNTNPQLGSSAYTPAQQSINVPQPDSEVGFKPPQEATASPKASAAATPVPITGSLIPAGQVSTSTSLSTDKKTFTVDFLSSTNFAGISSIIYNFSYTSDAGNRSVQGTVTVAAETIVTNATGQQYIRKLLTVGTCSGTNCTYDTNPKNFRLSISTN